MPVTDAPINIVSPDADDEFDYVQQLLTMATSIHNAIKAASPSGHIVAFAGATTPAGWILCDGQAVSRTTYAALFAAIGTTYGVGNGTTTFNVPNLKGRIPVGRDTAQTEFDVLGETGGAKTHTLTTAEMPSHQHNHDQSSGGNLSYSESGVPNQYVVAFGSGRMNTGIVTGNTGGGQAHNNLQPYMVMNFAIKA
ncbi:MAG: Tail Collar domain protein [Microbacterium sp.]|jgi:microcystin-dependent protein|nr:Tail Collar domain protein [Microbacterium sp.]